MKFLKQNDLSAQGGWGGTLLGHSATTTIGRAGCFWVAFTMAVNELLRQDNRPDTLQHFVLAKDPNTFKSSMLVAERAARVVGLVCLESERLRAAVGDPRLPDRVLAGLGLEPRSVCILHVDLDRDILGGDSEGDHFILAYAWRNGGIECADPATGRICILDDRTLKGDSVWNTTASGTKRFSVVGTIPIHLPCASVS